LCANHTTYVSGRSTSLVPAYFPKGIVAFASFRRYSFCTPESSFIFSISTTFSKKLNAAQDTYNANYYQNTIVFYRLHIKHHSVCDFFRVGITGKLLLFTCTLRCFLICIKALSVSCVDNSVVDVLPTVCRDT